MKTAIGIFLMVAGVILGLYVGGYIMFLGGIVDVIDQIRADMMDTGVLAWGIVKIVCASMVGGLAALLLWAPGQAMLFKD